MLLLDSFSSCVKQSFAFFFTLFFVLLLVLLPRLFAVFNVFVCVYDFIAMGSNNKKKCTQFLSFSLCCAPPHQNKLGSKQKPTKTHIHTFYGRLQLEAYNCLGNKMNHVNYPWAAKMKREGERRIESVPFFYAKYSQATDT